MVTTIKTTISLQKTLFDQSEILAQQLDISQNHLIEIAIENFIENYPSQALFDKVNKNQPDPNEQARSPGRDAKTATQIGEGQMPINQGDIYWLQSKVPGGSEAGYSHPHVVIQDNIFNHSRINTVVVCALTSNLKRTSEPGNVLLEAGEANLPKQSVIVVSQVSSVDKAQLGEYIGSLNERRIDQILAGMRFQQLSFFTR